MRHEGLFEYVHEYVQTAKPELRVRLAHAPLFAVIVCRKFAIAAAFSWHLPHRKNAAAIIRRDVRRKAITLQARRSADTVHGLRGDRKFLLTERPRPPLRPQPHPRTQSPPHARRTPKMSGRGRR